MVAEETVQAGFQQPPVIVHEDLVGVGARGRNSHYLLPKLLPLGRKRALLLSGLVFATWHVPLVFLTSLLPIGNPVISLPLFYAAGVAGSFFYGYLRLASGSVWPASIAHATHNSVSVMITGFTVTSSPLLVNVYLLGEFGIVITAAAAIAAALVSRLVPRDIEDHDSGTHAPVPDPASRTTVPQVAPQSHRRGPLP